MLKNSKTCDLEEAAAPEDVVQILRNAAEKYSQSLTYLCVKPCAASETADTDPIVPEDGIYVCGMQWDAVDQEEDEC